MLQISIHSVVIHVYKSLDVGYRCLSIKVKSQLAYNKVNELEITMLRNIAAFFKRFF